ncbi:TssA family type VI secretion system protein [Litorilituus sediminis]|uniref:Type VI secretion protein n=1 Tax=Litorilituus sediminis TaxID=718192 RepID=A0A4P6P6C1_9GAMM|nr:TssA family type VI secretion system protein [Litorilituus sediminis]QBG34915.1 type VI secretion protein [Litorilituus sediminis]
MSEHFTHENWSTWLEQLTSPLAESICGEDLKYEEDFKYLKTAFSGVNELDCKKVFVTGTSLLAEKSKDLRISSYVLCAAANDFGIEGITYGLALFNKLVGQYKEEVHPLKIKARAAVHTWLLGQQQRIIALAQQNEINNPEQIKALIDELNVYSSETVICFDENAGPLSELRHWAEKLSITYPVVAKKVAAKQDAQLAVEQALPENPSKLTNENNVAQPSSTSEKEVNVSQTANVNKAFSVESNSQYLDTVRKLLAFDKEKHNINRLICVARAIRWSDVKLPPHEQGKTRIPAPRAAAFAPIKNALANESYLEALLSAEALFMEGAMHFNLDLQAMVFAALTGLNQKQTIKQFSLALFQLTQQFPQLANLRYDDGSPLCSAKTKDLLAQISAEFSTTEAAGLAVDDCYDEIESQGKQLVADNKLAQALSLITDLPATTHFELAKQQLIKAKFCLLDENYDFAEPILQSLLKTVELAELERWQPDFAMQVWRNALLCFETLSTDKDDEYFKLTEQLKKQMILTQPEIALGWI